MKKSKISIMIICTLLCSVFCGCGDSKSSNSSAKITTVTQTQDTATTETTNTQTPAAPGSSTLFIYMCGSNLETKKGLAGKNIDELLAASVSDDLSIVIQTGGAAKWRSHDISADETQRYLIRDGKLELIMSLPQTNMGEADTLTDFLKWGQENYSSDRNILVMWDHGGGSTKGVCFDENYSFDSLTLPEMKRAFEDADIEKKFDIVGFDACLMASIEVAAVMSDYADYMVASEEIEPSGGWDYKVFAESINKDNNSVDIGKAICDSFIEKCNGKKNDVYSTLSVLNLSKVDPMLDRFTYAAKNLNRIAGNKNYFSQVLIAAKQSEKFGVENVFEGSSNMVDFIGFNDLVKLDEMFAWNEKQEFIEYSVNHENRDNSGVSFFYPINTSEDEIREYISLEICEEYNNFLSKYYLNAPEETIKFSDKGSIGEDGSFSIALTEDSHKYLAEAGYYLVHIDDAGTPHILCSDTDIISDWDNLSFKSNFTGVCPMLNGHSFYRKMHVDREMVLDYEIPAIVNGKNTFIRYYVHEGNYYLAGSCDGYNEDHLPVNSFITLESGDKIQLAEEIVLSGGTSAINYGEEFVLEYDKNDENDNECMVNAVLDGQSYQYVFVVTDIFGNTYFSDTATFEKQGDGFKAVKAEPTTHDYNL